MRCSKWIERMIRESGLSLRWKYEWTDWQGETTAPSDQIDT